MNGGYFMAKYSYELKKKVVREYLKGKGSSFELAKKYDITYPQYICEWAKVYQALGYKGLKSTIKHKEYSFEYKQSIIELYMSSTLTLREIAFQEGIPRPGIIGNWIRQYMHGGSDALNDKKKVQNKTMSAHDSKDVGNTKEQITSNDEYIKELEAELRKLRIENAFLKELRRLRLEDEAKMRESHESSPVSEDNSN